MPLITKSFEEIATWDQFVLGHPSGSIYHLSSYILCESKTKNHKPFARGALNANGELVAMLVAVEVQTFGGMASRWASRSILYAEPLFLGNTAGYEGVKQLLREHDSHMKQRVLFAEIRPQFPIADSASDLIASEGYERIGYVNFEVRIDQPEEMLFRQLGNKRRNNVRSSTRKGVTVEEMTTIEGTNQLYELLKITYEKSKVPLVDKGLFEAVINEFGRDQYRILIAKWENRTLAGACFLTFKDRVICWYAGTKRIAGLSGTTCVFWEAMKLYAGLGYRVFDLAGGGWEGEKYGPGIFKSKFGGEKLECSRYRKVYSPRLLRVAVACYSLLRRWR